MKRTSSILLVAGSIACASCSLFSEAGKTTVTGQVVDSVTGKPIGGAQVRLFANKNSSSSAAYSPAGDWRPADALGRFSFSFDADGSYSYILRASSARGDTGYETAPVIKGGRKHKDVRVPIRAVSWLRFHLHDELPRTTALSIQVWGFQDGFGIAPPVDTVMYRPIIASPATVVVWQIVKYNDEVEHRLPFPVGVDTFRVDIRY